MAKDDDYTVDKDSCDELDEVRKGKPCKFVMVVKGTTIVSLVVYKKVASRNTRSKRPSPSRWNCSTRARRTRKTIKSSKTATRSPGEWPAVAA